MRRPQDSTQNPVDVLENSLTRDQGNLGVLALLVAKGAELEKGDHLHWTPLTVAVVNSNIDAVALLLAAGASPSHKSRTGLMPHELPPMNPRPRRVLSVLLRAGAPLPRVSYGNWERSDNAHTRAARQYVAKIAAAGSWAAYEKAHTTRLVPVFEKVFPRPRLPHEIASHVVRFWFHTGDY